MQLRIETFQRSTGGEYVAVVAAEGELLSSGACGGGITERNAVTEAINAYFNKGTELRIEAPAAYATIPYAANVDNLLRRRASTPAQIRILVDELLATDGATATIEYEDRNGAITTRNIAVSRREAHRVSGGFSEDYLVAVDLDIDEPRSFRLDRIHWMETK